MPTVEPDPGHSGEAAGAIRVLPHDRFRLAAATAHDLAERTRPPSARSSSPLTPHTDLDGTAGQPPAADGGGCSWPGLQASRLRGLTAAIRARGDWMPCRLSAAGQWSGSAVCTFPPSRRNRGAGGACARVF